jgi:predicted permease
VSQPAPRNTSAGLLLFISVALVFLFAVMLSLVLVVGSRQNDKVPMGISIVVLCLPSVASVLTYLFLVRARTGRKGVAALSLFVGSIAALFLIGIPVLGLILAPAAVGGLALWSANRLLDPDVLPGD